ncbi:hypothetical protein [Pseudomonas sp. QC2]|uniref:hypothetical protein n=1 Tax=Pseudomonas sp. QC2 TaxID=2065822 RepID=UPI0011AF06FF|nr:hypothetical protein [Pseudomonas sp. QC2]
MKVLVSKEFQEKAERPENHIRFSVKKMISTLENLNPPDLERGGNVQRARGVSEEIYVTRIDSFRVFFTRQNDKLVLLDAEWCS